MTYCDQARTGTQRTPSARVRPPGVPYGAAGPETPLGLTIYGCDPDEVDLFRQLAPRFGILPTTTEVALSEATVELAFGNRCVSVGHKSLVSSCTLLALRRAGVRYLSTRSVGDDHIDVRFAARIGIAVETVDYSPDSVADYTLMLMLMAVRHAQSTVTRVHLRDYRLHGVRGRELRDLTIGVIGTGRIGAAVVQRLHGFGCRVLAHDRCPNTPAEYVTLDVLLERSDVVTLHTPLDTHNYHLLDHRRIGQMRRGAVVVNTARGALLDTEALLHALESGRLGGAALDVLEHEAGVFYSDLRHGPPGNAQLLRLQQLPNVVITPHTAYYSDHALSDTVEGTLTNCLRFERGAS